MSTPPLVVVGGSAGGLDAATRLVGALDAEFPAAVVVVLHQAPGADDYIARRLRQSTVLVVEMAEDGGPLEPGHVYVAPADRHLRFDEGTLRVAFGPRVNRVRPAIDVALRSAAAEHGARAVGVILSGLLDDGAAGLDALHRSGGRTLVQDPDDAEHGDMPANALRYVEPDAVASAEALAERLDAVVRALPDDAGRAPDDVRTEARIDALATGDIDMTQDIGDQVPVSCSDCGGPVWEIHQPGPTRYRCHVGHAFSQQSMLRSQEETVEESLWVALRTLEERARMLDRLSGASRSGVATSYRDQADETRVHAGRIRDLLAARHEIEAAPALLREGTAAPTARA